MFSTLALPKYMLAALLVAALAFAPPTSGRQLLLTPAPGPSLLRYVDEVGADIPAPFSNRYGLQCNGQDGVMTYPAGSYSYIPSNSSNLQPIVTAVQQAWLNQTGDRPTGCAKVADNLQQPRLNSDTSACSQVVAGTNYALLVQQSLNCMTNGSPEMDNVTIAAIVYQPLGTAAPQVTYLRQIQLSQQIEG